MSDQHVAPVRRTRAPRWMGFVSLGLTVLLLAVFPPFRVVSLKPGSAAEGGSRSGGPATPVAFDAIAYASSFWASQLLPAAGNAPDLQPLMVALRADPAVAAREHGRQVGLGGPVYYFVRALGRVTTVERSRLIIEIDGSEGATVALRTGPVFGNTVRDGCGLLEVNRAPGLQEFNAVSAELNRLVEERVQPVLKTGVGVGTRLVFAGCAEAPEEVGDGPLLTVIPVMVEVQP